LGAPVVRSKEAFPASTLQKTGNGIKIAKFIRKRADFEL
jgi:hypothetical protein